MNELFAVDLSDLVGPQNQLPELEHVFNGGQIVNFIVTEVEQLRLLAQGQPTGEHFNTHLLGKDALDVIEAFSNPFGLRMRIGHVLGDQPAYYLQFAAARIELERVILVPQVVQNTFLEYLLLALGVHRLKPTQGFLHLYKLNLLQHIQTHPGLADRHKISIVGKGHRFFNLLRNDLINDLRLLQHVFLPQVLRDPTNEKYFL
jgi:hypothetical protein